MKVLLKRHGPQVAWLESVCRRLRSEGHQLVFAARSLSATLKKNFYDAATQQIRGIDCIVLTHSNSDDEKQAVELVRSAPNSKSLRVILVSNFLTWAGRHYESTVECSPTSLANRTPLSVASSLLLLENKLLSTAFGSGIQVFVLAMGVMYGGDGADLKDYLLALFHKKACHIPVRAGAEALASDSLIVHSPMVHVNDAVNACVHMITTPSVDALPAAKYVPVIDQTSIGLAEVMHRIAEELGWSYSFLTQEQQYDQLLEGRVDCDWKFMANLQIAGAQDEKLPDQQCKSLDACSATSGVVQEFLRSNHLGEGRIIVISAPSSMPPLTVWRLAEHAQMGFASIHAALEHFVSTLLPVLHGKKIELQQEAAATAPPAKPGKKGKDPPKEEPLSEEAMDALTSELQAKLIPAMFEAYQLVNQACLDDGKPSLERLVETTEPIPVLITRMIEQLSVTCKATQLAALLRLVFAHLKASGFHGYILDGTGLFSDDHDQNAEIWAQLFDGANQPTSFIEVNCNAEFARSCAMTASGGEGDNLTKCDEGDFEERWTKWERQIQQLQIPDPSSVAEEIVEVSETADQADRDEVPASPQENGTASPNEQSEQGEFSDGGHNEGTDPVEEAVPEEPTPKFVTRFVHAVTLLAEEHGVPTQQVQIASQEQSTVLAQLGQALVASHGPVGWLDQKGEELLHSNTYLTDPPPPNPISRPTTAHSAAHDGDEETQQVSSDEASSPRDPEQELLAKYKDELEARTTQLMDVALSTVLPEVTQALLQIRAEQPEDPLRYLINFLKEKEARQFAKAEAEAFLAYKGRMAVFAAEDRIADEKQAMYAQMSANLDRNAF